MQRKLRLLKRNYGRAQRRHVRRLKILGRHPFAVPVLTFVVLVGLAAAAYYSLNSNQPKQPDNLVVIVSHDGIQQTVPSKEPTVGDLLKKLNLQLNRGDVVEPAADTSIKQDNFRINIYRAVPVEIIENGHKSFTFSAATTARSIAKQQGVTVYPEDAVSVDPVQDFVRDGSIGQEVIVDPATPVNLNLYGTPVATRTQARTVAELIKEKNIHLAKDDQVTPALTSPITPGQQIFVTRNGTKIESVTQNIPMPVQVIQDSSLAYGTSAVRQAGSAGQEIITYQINLQNGQEVSRTAIQTVVTQQPVTQIVAKGINLGGIKGDMALAGISPDNYNYVDYIVSHESNWNPQAENASGAYGLCQALPGSKMAGYGSDWRTNPVTQLKWCNYYADSKYGSWASAYHFWVSHHYW